MESHSLDKANSLMNGSVWHTPHSTHQLIIELRLKLQAISISTSDELLDLGRRKPKLLLFMVLFAHQLRQTLDTSWHHSTRSHYGIIPQDPTLFSGSVRYNIDPLSEHTDTEIWQVPEKCHLLEAVQETEEGFDETDV
ncbi:hypothetical protein POM88_033271 [Heracleum sosnowskyi]|uniref:Uncharacterized protein n=1 Tax=Heracleum sosnowskyi TaxID=360622 RepID=A0AAD8I1S8_9APIA|nr:hypothetical protein POM88_033271 [Heracleum sosnowskyi]